MENVRQFPAEEADDWRPSPTGRTRIIRGGRLAIAWDVQDRGFRFAATIALTLAVPLAALFYLEFRSLAALRARSVLVLEQLSVQTLNNTVDEFRRLVRLAPRVLNSFDKAKLEPLDLSFAKLAFDDAFQTDTFGDRFYIWSDQTSVHRGDVLAYDRSNASFQIDREEGPQLVRTIVDTLAARQSYAAVLEMPIRGRETFLVLRLHFSPHSRRLSSFAALAIDGETFRRQHLASLLTAARQSAAPPNIDTAPPLDLVVLDERGGVMLPPHGPIPPNFTHERALPLEFILPSSQRSLDVYQGRLPTWRVQTTYGDHTIAGIVDNELRPIWAAATIVNIMMIAGVVCVALAAGRRVRLAELKSSFVASVSHDLKTPLTQIQLFAETLDLGRLKSPHQVREYYRIIHNEARKLNRLIDNILDFSRIEARLVHYHPESQDLVSLTATVLASLESRFRQDQFAVTFRPAPAPVHVMTDATATQQALENVLLNAIKYSPAERAILVEVYEANGHGGIRITDRGMGIPKPLHKKVFQKFYRVNRNDSSGPQGCGLGLAIVDHVVRAHRGFIEVDSDVGLGTSIALNFPLEREA